MVNCNPETVSTDYDTSDRLYFEPLTLEDVLNIVEREQPLRRHRPVRRPDAAQARGAARAGGRADPGHVARRHRPGRGPRALRRAARGSSGSPRPPSGTARSFDEAARIAATHRLPGAGAALLRAGRARHGDRLRRGSDLRALHARGGAGARPSTRSWSTSSWRTRIEIDVDAVADGERVVVGGVMEHIEKAGIHSGDSACALPPYSLGDDQVERLRAQTRALARELGVVGLINIQFAIKNEHDLRARGQPARLAHRALRLQGDRRAAGQAGDAGDARRDARRARLHRGARAAATSRSRRRSSPSSSSPAWTPSSGPRCGPPARSWGSTATSARPISSRSSPPARPCPPRARSSSRSRTGTSARSLPHRRAAGRDGLHARGHRRAPPSCSSATGMTVELIHKVAEGWRPEHRRPHEARARSRWSSTRRRTAAPGRTPTSSGARRSPRTSPTTRRWTAPRRPSAAIEALLKGEMHRCGRSRTTMTACAGCAARTG